MSKFVAIVNSTLHSLAIAKQNSLVEIGGEVFAANIYMSEDKSITVVEEVKKLDVEKIENIIAATATKETPQVTATQQITNLKRTK